MNDPKREAKRKEALRQGEVIMLILITINAVELWLALGIKYQTVMMVTMAFLALVDVLFILVYYMHLERVFSNKEDHS